jgi:hypothetical protein
MEMGKKGCLWDPVFFWGRLVQLRKVPVAPGKPADGERYGGGLWVFRVIGITVHFLLGPGDHRGLGYDVSCTGLKTGFQRNVRSSDFFKNTSLYP